jgi:hypothetical protein
MAHPKEFLLGWNIFNHAASASSADPSSVLRD